MIRDNQKVLIGALVISILVMGAKLAAFFITTSNAILSDALESFINVAAGIFALFSITIAARPKDKDHPYGHGKIEFLSAGLEGFLVGIAGLFIIGKAVYNLFQPQGLGRLDIGMYITIATGLTNFFLGYYLKIKAKKFSSITIEANGRHIMSDAVSSAGLLIGLLLIYYTEIEWIDNVVALGFGALIFYTGYNLVRKSVAGVMDEADQEIIEEIIAVLNENRKENWIDIHNFRVIKYGSDLHIDCHITLPWYYELRKCHEELKVIESIIYSRSKGHLEIFIHSDPCIPTSCSVCQISECPVRQEAFRGKITWKLSNITGNKKHDRTDLGNV